MRPHTHHYTTVAIDTLLSHSRFHLYTSRGLDSHPPLPSPFAPPSWISTRREAYFQFSSGQVCGGALLRVLIQRRTNRSFLYYYPRGRKKSARNFFIRLWNQFRVTGHFSRRDPGCSPPPVKYLKTNSTSSLGDAQFFFAFVSSPRLREFPI